MAKGKMSARRKRMIVELLESENGAGKLRSNRVQYVENFDANIADDDTQSNRENLIEKNV
jgi:hypothetical protein